MARRTQSRGTCIYCNRDFTRSGMTRHLESCPKRAEAIESEKKEGKSEAIYHLIAYDQYGPDFWLHLEMPGAAVLQDLDKYLRAIWLECCGHLSEFWRGRAWSGIEIDIRSRIDRAMPPEAWLTHVYDFGSSSYTIVQSIAARRAVWSSRYPVRLLARNIIPELPCAVCREPATWACMECRDEWKTEYAFCEKHAGSHDHDPAYFARLVNSPRVGICGPIESAEPPY